MIERCSQTLSAEKWRELAGVVVAEFPHLRLLRENPVAFARNACRLALRGVAARDVLLLSEVAEGRLAVGRQEEEDR